MTIHLYASLGDRNKTAAGGGQTSARRLVKVLEGLGYEVQVVNRIIPAYTSESLVEKIHKIAGYFIDPFRYFFHLLFKSRRNGVSFVIMYAGRLFPFYFSFVRIGKLLGFRTVIYIKGSFTKDKYQSLSTRMKESYASGLRKVDLAFYEGKDGEETSLKVNPQTKAVWLPNYIENDFMPKCLVKRDLEPINIMYFGRLDPGKNIILVVETFDLLCQRLDNIRLNIVGSGESEYTKLIEKRISQSPYKDRIIRTSRIDHDKLKEFLPSQHFYLFPTESEGHSNALTEAMAYGVVPIASRRGFNASVVGNDSIIVDEMKAEAYRDVVMNVLENDIFDSLSNEMFERVRTHFNQTVVEKKLANELNLL